MMKIPSYEDDPKLLVSRIFYHILRGARPSNVHEKLKEEGCDVSREHASRVVWEAVRNQRLRYVPDTEESLTSLLRQAAENKWGSAASGLKTVRVISAASVNQMAICGAETLLQIIMERWSQVAANERSLRIGFSGGITSALILEELAKLIRERWKISEAPAHAFPRSLVFHSINGLLANGNPESNPSRYFQAFDEDFPVKTEFVLFPAPGVILESEWPTVKSLQSVSEALSYVPELDVILGSGGHWEKGHKTLWDYVSKSCIHNHSSARTSHTAGGTDANAPGTGASLYKIWTEEADNLGEKQSCAGDLFWQPVFRDIPDKTVPRKIRIPSLFELKDLPGFVSQGKRVLIVLAGCSACKRAKDEILKAILEWPIPPMVSDLLVTSQTAGVYLQSLKGELNGTLTK